ncbi:MAG TPA: PadR family transcriptional regulator [Prolixibacteraceae bacterium]|nr:PadR family transcriptional regulator [Prolixibacteraceae bacterium]
MKNVTKQLVGAAAPKFILTILALGDSYGLEIVQRVKELTNGEINWQAASIYPVLKKMEAVGLICSDWRMGETVRPRKYYRITEEGKAELQNQKNEWDAMNKIFTILLGGQNTSSL